VVLVHEDIYSSEDGVGLLLHLRYIADLVIRAAPLSTGLAADVHGQVRFLFTDSHTFFTSWFCILSGHCDKFAPANIVLILKDDT
jgi:hypothetical protein